MNEQANYQLAFVLPDSRQALGLASPRGAEFPAINIPLWDRPVQRLTERIHARWRIRTIVLDILASPTAEIPCAVIEVQSRGWDFGRAGFSALPKAGTSIPSLSDSQRETLAAILSDDDSNREPLARIGWVQRAQQWIEESVTDHREEFSENVFHVNGCAPFALVRFETRKGSSYWLKATGWPNTHELSVTRMLTERFPSFLPSLVATRQDWNAWVTADAGPTLRDSPTLPMIERVVASLASLQKQSTSQIGSLSASGCFDCTIPELEAHVDELVDYLDEAMQLQTSTRVERLDGQQLNKLRSLLRNACCRMRELDIPDSLVLGDINPGNILFDGTSFSFIDWAEASIGNPFVNFEHLVNHIRQLNQQDRDWAPLLRESFKQQWLDMLTESKIEDAFALAPVLAIATCLHGRGAWLRSPRRNEASFQAFARSLARRMYHTALSPGCKEALCQ